MSLRSSAQGTPVQNKRHNKLEISLINALKKRSHGTLVLKEKSYSLREI